MNLMNETIKTLISIICAALIIYFLIQGTADSRAFKKITPIEVESTLIEINYLQSTKKGNLAPNRVKLPVPNPCPLLVQKNIHSKNARYNFQKVFQ
jgi:hypothetical protein